MLSLISLVMLVNLAALFVCVMLCFLKKKQIDWSVDWLIIYYLHGLLCRRHWQDSSGWAIKLVNWWKLARQCCLHLKKPSVLFCIFIIGGLAYRVVSGSRIRSNGWFFLISISALNLVYCFYTVGWATGEASLMWENLFQLSEKVYSREQAQPSNKNWKL